MSQFPTTQPAKGSFPIRRARMAPPTVGPSVPASLDTETGEGAAAARITRTGTGLMSFGLDALAKLKAAQDEIDLSTKKREYDEIMANALLAAQQAPDEEAAQAIMVEAQKQAEALEEGITSGTVMRGLQMHHDRIKPRWEATIKLGILKQQVDNLKASAEVNMAKDLAINTDESLARVEATLNTLYENGIINDSQRDEGIANKEFNGVLHQAMTGKLDPGIAENMLSSLKPTTVKQAREVESALAFLHAKGRQDKKAKDEEDERRFWSLWELRFVEGVPLRYDQVVSELGRENGIEFWKLILAEEESIKAGTEKQLREGNPKTLARTYAAIALNPWGVNRAALLQSDRKLKDGTVVPGMMSQLGYNNVKEVTQFLDQERAKPNPRLQRYVASLERLRAAGSLGGDEERELNFVAGLRQLNDYMKSEKVPDDRALEDFYKQMVLGLKRRSGWVWDDVPKGVIPGLTDLPRKLGVSEAGEVWVKNLDTIWVGHDKNGVPYGYRVEGKSAKEGGGYKLVPIKAEPRR